MSVTAFAPGRVNLVGEHTDYDGGLALPFAISAGVTVRGALATDGFVEVLARDLDQRDRFSVREPPPVGNEGERGGGWRAFVRGVLGELGGLGVVVPGARLEISSDLPREAGLSSSAALTVALALALLALADAPVPDAFALAELCSRVEREWVGAPTGLLDQLASRCGVEGHALRIDFAASSIEPVPLALGDWRLVVLDCGERRALAGSGYAERRREHAAACAQLGVERLRDAAPVALATLPDSLARRARHILSENARVEQAVAALRGDDLPALGPLLDASHASLRDDYEVSTPALERTVARLRAAGATGARLVGGGFGGNALALFPPGAEPPLTARDVTPAPGARLLA